MSSTVSSGKSSLLRLQLPGTGSRDNDHCRRILLAMGTKSSFMCISSKTKITCLSMEVGLSRFASSRRSFSSG